MPGQMPSHVGLVPKLAMQKKIKELIMQGKTSEAQKLMQALRKKK